MSLLKKLKFFLASKLLIVHRSFKNFVSPLPRFKQDKVFSDAPIISSSETLLWYKFNSYDEWILTAGKIENLRVALLSLDGLNVKAGQTFSFWKHIGYPSKMKGYRVGRELRGDKIMSLTGGGLCQLSSTLYDAALGAKLEIVERHKHSKIISGSLSMLNRDATVKWNYLDLRFKANFDFSIHVALTSNKLIIQFRSEHKKDEINTWDCINETAPENPPTVKINSVNTTAYIVDEKWNEYADYIQHNYEDGDILILPSNASSFQKIQPWETKGYNVAYSNRSYRWNQFLLRYCKKNIHNEAYIRELNMRISKSIARLIPLESTHLVVSQNFVPFLRASGSLAGRTYDVLMTSLPLYKFQERITKLYQKYPSGNYYTHLQIPEFTINSETKALSQADQIITPHYDIGRIYPLQFLQLNWILPNVKPLEQKGNKILFPSSGLAHSGAFEIKQLALELNLSFVITNGPSEYPNFWDGVTVELFNGNFEEIGLIVYPAYISNYSNLILSGIALEIPIILTKACGIENSKNITLIPHGNYPLLKRFVAKHLDKISDNNE